MRRAVFRPRIGAFLLLSALVSCGGDPTEVPQPASVRDSAGVTIYENPGGDRPLSATATRIAELHPPDSALTAVPWGVTADPMTGRIYVADRLGTRVAVFDESGVFLSSIGREGDGPGEFRSPSATTLDPFGALTVWDTGRGVLSRWSSEGDLLNEQRPPLTYWGPGFSVGPNRVTTVVSGTGASDMEMVQHLVTETTEGTDTLQTHRSELALMELPCLTSPAPKIFMPSMIWTHRVDSIYVVAGPEYRIDRWVNGARDRSVRRATPPTEGTLERAVRSAESGPGPYALFMERCGVTAEQVVRAVGFETEFSPILGIAIDPTGRLWVSRSTDGPLPAVVDLFDANGVYLGTLDLPEVPLSFLSSTRFLTLRVDESTGQTVVSIFELGETPAAPEPVAVSGETDRFMVDESRGEFRDCAECPIMVAMPTGRFRMGARDGEAPASRDPNRPAWTEAAERPRVDIEIDDPFAIGKFEVTFAEWEACRKADGCSHDPDDEGWGRDDHPVMNVTRADAEGYAAWLSETTGRRYRLPSEAEWEYAARAGTTTSRHWGDEVGDARASCDGCGSRWDNRSTAPVGSFPANPFGLYDMLGNVEEWVADCWHDSHEGRPSNGEARIETSPWWKEGACERPVQKGGAFSFFPWAVRSAARGYFHPGPWGERSSTVGFRVAAAVEEN